MSDIVTLGVPTFHTRVEAWECDHNQHWNVRQYMRVFRLAGHVARDIAGAPTAMPFSQLSRFHRELVQTSPVEVRSAVLSDGPLAGFLVHLLCSGGRLSATAIEGPALAVDPSCGLPFVRADQVAAALPRGLEGGAHVPRTTGLPGGFKIIEHGLVQPRELDHLGWLTVDFLMSRIAAATNDRLSQLGFTPDFVRETGISRMGVESRVSILAPIPLGTRLRSVAGVVKAEGKNIVIRHGFFRNDGAEVAASDQSLVTVDMSTRRSCPLPDFLLGAVDMA